MKEQNEQKQSIKRMILLIFAVLLVIAGILWYRLGGLNKAIPKKEQPDTPDTEQTSELSERPSYYPEYVTLGQSLEDAVFYTKDEEPVALKERQGNYLILSYWGSYCSYCKDQLSQMNTFVNVLEEYPNVSYLLVDKLDEEKETKENALAYLEQEQIEAENVFDVDLTVYEELGIKRIPTTIILDPESRVLFCYTGVIKSASMLEAMLSYAVDGYSEATYDFVCARMLNEDGGMKTGTDTSDSHPSGEDVLSESQGLLMQYAVEADDKQLFERAYQYAKEHLQREGVFVWYESQGEPADSNAFLDDLRIYEALCAAEEKWGGYEQEITSLEDALTAYNLTEDGPVDFYDFASQEKGKTFSLCYADLKTIGKLAEATGQDELLTQTEEIVENGYISDDFPFYYPSYSYEEKSYKDDDLNMAEAMYTLYHLAKAGKLKETSEDWIMEHLVNGGIMARYHTDGSMVDGYGYESTGIYALTALIGLETDNREMVTASLNRMQATRIYDSASVYNGAFGNEDGTGIYSFDQCMSLLVYGKLDRWRRDELP